MGSDKRLLVRQSEMMTTAARPLTHATSTNDALSSSSTSPIECSCSLQVLQDFKRWYRIDPVDSNVEQSALCSKALTTDDLGLNALHHSIQSYSELSTLSSTHNEVNQCPQHIVEFFVKSREGSLACTQTTHDGLFTPLHLCCRSIVPDGITKVIAKANPDAISMQDEEGDTPLHSAFRYGASDEVVKTLVELAYNNYQVDEEECAFAKINEEGESSLHTAISHDASGESVRLLLDAHPQGIWIVNSRGQTPLQVAAEYGRYDIIEVMVESHASIDSVESLLRMKDEIGLTPIFLLWNQVCNISENADSANASATSNLSMEVLECISTLLTSTQCCIEQSASSHENLSDADYLAYHLLQISICLGSNTVPEDYVSFLIKNHPGILRQPDSEGRLPLHLANMRHEEITDDSQHTHFGQFSEHHGELVQSSHLWMDADVDSLKHFVSFDSLDCHQSRQNNQTADSSNSQPTPCRSGGRMAKIILDGYPNAAYLEDKSGKLPFHLAIEAGMPWDEIESLLKINPHAIPKTDPTTGLLPFMMAAQGRSYEPREKLNTVFRLLISSPDVVLSSIERVNDTGSYMPSPPKRRRLEK
jgi:ankyrin repeat protein